MKEIGIEVFCNCRKLKRVVFSDARVEGAGIEKGCCADWYVQPERKDSALKIIGQRAFCGCVSLNSVILPDHVEEIGAGAFRASGLESFAAPHSLRIIWQGAFERCKCLKHVELNDGLEVLGTDEYQDRDDMHGVFRNSALESISLPATLKRIERDTFACCTGLRRIVLPERLEFIGEYCFQRSSLRSVRLPPALRIIEAGVFCKCQSLKSVKLPERLEGLGLNAFQMVGIESIVFPASLRTIA